MNLWEVEKVKAEIRELLESGKKVWNNGGELMILLSKDEDTLKTKLRDLRRHIVFIDIL